MLSWVFRYIYYQDTNIGQLVAVAVQKELFEKPKATNPDPIANQVWCSVISEWAASEHATASWLALRTSIAKRRLTALIRPYCLRCSKGIY